MALRAMRLRSVPRLESIPAQNVFLMSYSLKVVRVPAIANTTQVVNLKIADRADK